MHKLVKNGSGKKIKKGKLVFWDQATESGLKYKSICEACNGSGRILGIPCPVCKGEKYISMK